MNKYLLILFLIWRTSLKAQYWTLDEIYSSNLLKLDFPDSIIKAKKIESVTGIMHWANRNGTPQTGKTALRCKNEYDSIGNIIVMVYSRWSVDAWGTGKLTYQWKDGHIVLAKYMNGEEVFNYIYLSQNIIGEINSRNKIKIFKYDSLQNLIKLINIEGKDSTTYEFYYNNLLLVKALKYVKSGFVKYADEIKFSYNNNGKLSKLEIFDDLGVKEFSELEYDISGNLFRFKHSSKFGVNAVEYVYQDNLLKKIFFRDKNDEIYKVLKLKYKFYK